VFLRKLQELKKEISVQPKTLANNFWFDAKKDK
jgi:hypothetical protein